MSEVYIYILVMALTSFAIRVLPLTLIQTEIKNPLIKSFLYYVPYITLAVMTFPAIIQVTQTPLSGAIALVIGIVLSWFGANLDRKSTRLNSSHMSESRMPSSA